ncbi:MAG: hypothetical protein QM537_08795, partial [Candidatus Symbiobacter sp.]|nr:hypothetical protein [Candidatus Symbiobacter sp.]
AHLRAAQPRSNPEKSSNFRMLLDCFAGRRVSESGDSIKLPPLSLTRRLAALGFCDSKSLSKASEESRKSQKIQRFLAFLDSSVRMLNRAKARSILTSE